MFGNITDTDLGRTQNIEGKAGRLAVRLPGFDMAAGTAATTDKGTWTPITLLTWGLIR